MEHMSKQERRELKRETRRQEKERSMSVERRKEMAVKLAVLGVTVVVIGVLAMSLINPKGGQNAVDFKRAVGRQAPDFSLQDMEGKTARLGDHRGKNVVLFFSEGEMCYPACWDQISALGNDERLNSNGTVAFSIVVDTKGQWQRIIEQAPKLSNAKLLFDTGREVSATYNVLNLPSSMHRGSTPGHTYFIVDKAGVIRYAFDDTAMGVRNEQLVSELSRLD